MTADPRAAGSREEAVRRHDDDGDGEEEEEEEEGVSVIRRRTRGSIHDARTEKGGLRL